MNFDMTKPCGNCPFRSDIDAFLHPERAEEICDALVYGQQTFACHKTIDYSEDSDGETTNKSQHCAGAMILLEKMKRPNQLMRIAGRTGAYNAQQLDMGAPVFDDPAEMIEACEFADERKQARRAISRG